MTRAALRFSLFLFVFSTFFFHPHPTQAIGNAGGVLPAILKLRQPVSEREKGLVRHVQVQGVLDLPVVQQPSYDPYYVSNRGGEVTQFSLVSPYGNIGLLAHNTLSGRSFSKLSIGQEVQVTYEDGSTEYFIIRQILRFQALDPESISSSFRSLDSDAVLSSAELFSQAYGGDPRLVFQTCIEAEGNVSWGRLFVIALPRQ